MKIQLNKHGKHDKVKKRRHQTTEIKTDKLCKELLQRILLDLNIDHIEYPELQKAIKPEAEPQFCYLYLFGRYFWIRTAYLYL